MPRLGLVCLRALSCCHTCLCHCRMVGCAGQVLRLCMDPGGVLAICCHSDGCVRMYDVKSGALMWWAWGHAAHVAAAALSPDLTQLLSVGGDGCIVVWKLPGSLVQQLQAAAGEVAAAKEQAGCFMPSPAQLPANRSLSDVSAASPGPAGTAAATAGGLSTPQWAGSAGGADAVTPSSCSSDGGFSSILKRIQQGKPLVSVDKLPRWARPPSAASSSKGAAAAAGRQHSASEGGAYPLQQQQQPQSRWLGRNQSADGNISSATSDPGTQVHQNLSMRSILQA
jgi:WD40 repeat protein